MELNVGNLLNKWTAYSPNKVAIIYEEREITYKELNDRVNRTSNWLLAKGIKNGDRISVLLYNSLEFIELFFAASRIGAIFCPMSFRLTPQEIEYQLNDSGSKLLVFDKELTENVGAIRSNVCLEENAYYCVGIQTPVWAIGYRKAVNESSIIEPKPLKPIDWENVQIIMYTSGTTGNPKGAMLSHRKTFFNTLNAFFYHELRFEDIFLSPYPLFHSAGLLIYTLPSLSRGATVVLRRNYTPEQMLKDIEKYRVTTFGAVTTVLKRILDSGMLDNYETSSIRIFGGGGEKTSIDLIEKLAEKGLYLQQRFGQTETSTICSLQKKDASKKKGSVGLPVLYADVKIVDKRGKELPPYENGEVVVKGPTLMTGYWNKGEETAETIVDGILHTGDLAYKDKEGYFYIVDRVKDMYRSGGENVYPAEIEKILLVHPKISQVAIIGVPDEKWTEVGKAFILPKERGNLNKKEVLEFLKGKVAKFKIPSYVQFVDRLPMTSGDKVKKIELKKKFSHVSEEMQKS